MEKEFTPMPIGYSGEVHISYKRNGKVYESHRHNAGVAGLFKFVCKALAGANVSGEIPKYLDLEASLDGVSYSSILTSEVQLSGQSYYQENGDWLYKASASIPAASLTISFDDETYSYFRLCLMAKVGQSKIVFAHVEPDEADLRNITPGTQALVEWVIRFQNLDGTQG
jgi:hypothetical protein